MPKTQQKGLAAIWTVIIVVVLLALAGASYWLYQTKKLVGMPSKNNTTTPKSTSGKWQEQGVVIPGQFADADVVDLGEGKFRLYYAAEPEASNFNGQIYSATSTDGKTWTKEEGTRKTQAAFPDVISLPDSKWRMYYQTAGVIKSAVSSDGLNFTDEAGTRIDQSEAGFKLENVGAQSTSQLENGDYIMVYRGDINEPYQTTEKIPNQTTELYFWATSKDGLTFEKKGIAIDSRNDTLYGLADGADWVNWDDGNLRVYFWSYSGVYYAVLENASTNDLQKFSNPTFTFMNQSQSAGRFPENPPCDPTLANINNQWFMYYGQHLKGIYAAVLTN